MTANTLVVCEPQPQRVPFVPLGIASRADLATQLR
jgi:hypothetical protein